MFLIYLGTLMIPQEVLVVPMFMIMRELGWINSYAGLIMPWAFTAFGTFLLRQFFMTLPRELEEAAIIDGASIWTVYWRILLPLTRPAMGTLAVFTFIGYWNSFLWPLLIVSDVNMATVPLGLNMFLGQTGNQWNLFDGGSDHLRHSKRASGHRATEIPRQGNRPFRSRRPLVKPPPTELIPRTQPRRSMSCSAISDTCAKFTSTSTLPNRSARSATPSTARNSRQG